MDPCPHGGQRSTCPFDSCIDPEPLDLQVTRELTNAYARACDELVLREAHRLGLPGTPEEQAQELVRRGYGFKYPDWLSMDASSEGRIGIKLPEFCILPAHERSCTCSARWDKGADGMHADSCPCCLHASGLPQARL